MRPGYDPDPEDLELPPLDGAVGGELDDDEQAEVHDDPLDVATDDAAALDDATSEEDAIEELSVDGTESGWLVDGEEGGATLDVGTFDVALADEGEILEADDLAARGSDDIDLGESEEIVHMDGGEEGPLADDDELREEDLPALAADDDGDVDEASLYEGGTLETGEELRWDDRAWARALLLLDVEPQDVDDSGMLVVPGDEAKHAARDATWKRLEETGRITAAVVVPGESVVLALDGPERPVLVRVLLDGLARIIAEIDITSAEDEPDACRVTNLRWDATRGCVIAVGPFGIQAFRPA